MRGLFSSGLLAASLLSGVVHAQGTAAAPASAGAVATPQQGTGQLGTGQRGTGAPQQGTGQQGASNTSSTTSSSATEAARQQRQRAQDEHLAQAADLTHDVPTAFQQLVQTSIGYPLPIFGASLFASPVDTFVQADNIPVPTDYVIGPGDELRIEVYGQVNQQRTVTVDRSGDIS